MTIILRSATFEDASAISEVLLSSRLAFLHYAPFAHSHEEVRNWVAANLVPSGGVVVACDDSGVVGFIATSHQMNATWIDQMYILPSHVGQGIGGRLLGHALRSVTAPIRLYAFQRNDKARAFYERWGFKAIEFTDGRANEENCPDVLYELTDLKRVQ